MKTRMFDSLKNPNYRLWAAGALVSNVGTWMQRVAQDWLVLTVLTNQDGAAVGITTGLQFLPVLLLGPYAGVLGDRLDKRKILMVTQAAMGTMALIQGLLVISGQAQLWHIYVLAFLLGVASAFDAPPRQAFVSEIVGRDKVVNAVALNAASFNLARMAGPGIAGVLISLIGTGWLFLLNAVSFAAVLISLSRMNVGELKRTKAVPKGRGQLREGVKYVLGRPRTLLVMVMGGIIGTFTLNFQISNAVMAAGVFHEGPGAYGILGSIMAIGTFSGALLAARRAAPRMRYLVTGAVGLGVSTIVAAFMPSFLTYAIVLVFIGLSAITFLNSANTLLQVRTDPQYRGRVLALYMTIIQGGTPIGAPLFGWVSNVLGPRWAVFGGGALALIVGLTAVVLLSRWDEGSVRRQFRSVWLERRLHARGAHDAGQPAAVVPPVEHTPLREPTPAEAATAAEASAVEAAEIPAETGPIQSVGTR